MPIRISGITAPGALEQQIGFVVLSVAGLLVPGPVEATPAYARLYGPACAACHAPLPPRLNNFGMLFRRAGFRLPDTDPNGRLIFQTAEPRGLPDAASLSAAFGGRRDQEAAPGESRSTLQLGEIEVVAASPIGRHLSAQAMFIPHSEEGEIELEDLQVQVNAGKPAHMLSVRAGLAEMNFWQKVNHGSLTLAQPLIFAEEPAAPVGDFAGVSFVRQIAMEGGYTFTRVKGERMSTTILSAAVLNGLLEDGTRAERNTSGGADVYVQALQLFGERNTAGVFYYDGSTVIDPLGALPIPGPFDARFSRVGILGNYVFFKRLDMVVGAIRGRDRSDQIGGTVDSRGLFAELDAQIGERWVAVYRRDAFDPDRDTRGDFIGAHTLSATWQAEDHLYLTAEYRRAEDSGETDRTFAGNLRLIY